MTWTVSRTLCLATLLLAGATHAQVEWTQLNPPTSPVGSIDCRQMVFDEARGTVGNGLTGRARVSGVFTRNCFEYEGDVFHRPAHPTRAAGR